MLERCHWESNVWIDGKSVGTQNSLSAPHLYDLGALSPGRHMTVCIDNTYKIPIGTWAHAITEDTQGNWNGIVGRIELRATDPVWIRDVQVFEPFAGQIREQYRETGIRDRQEFLLLHSGRRNLGKTPFAPNAKAWDEFSPALTNWTSC